MKKLKQIDFYVSVVLIFNVAVFTIFADSSNSIDSPLIPGYILVGAWHCFSMIVHQWKGVFSKEPKRSMYHFICLVALLTIPLGSFIFLFFLAPFMAIFYTWLCYDETFHRMRRPLSYIK